jgi:hypothetical protein
MEKFVFSFSKEITGTISVKMLVLGMIMIIIMIICIKLSNLL